MLTMFEKLSNQIRRLNLARVCLVIVAFKISLQTSLIRMSRKSPHRPGLLYGCLTFRCIADEKYSLEG